MEEIIKSKTQKKKAKLAGIKVKKILQLLIRPSDLRNVFFFYFKKKDHWSLKLIKCRIVSCGETRPHALVVPFTLRQHHSLWHFLWSSCWTCWVLPPSGRMKPSRRCCRLAGEPKLRAENRDIWLSEGPRAPLQMPLDTV